MIKERRRHARLRIPLEAEYQVAGEDAWRQGTIWTLGAGGAALLCDEKLAEGTVLDGLHFVVEAEGDLPETRIEVGAEVVNVDREGDFGCRSCFMLGLRFMGLAEPEFELLRQFVFRRLTGAQPPSAEPPAEPGETAGAPPIEIRFKLFDEFVDEVSENLSPTGMFIRAHRPLPPGSRLAFQYQLGEDFSLFQGTAEVVWTRRRSEGLERPPGMGVRFLELDPTSRRLIRRLVDQRDAEEAAEPRSPAVAEEPEARAEAVAEPLSTPDIAGASQDAADATQDAADATQVTDDAARGTADAAPDTTADAGSSAGSEEATSRLRRLEERLGESEAAGDEARERLSRLAVEADALREQLRAAAEARAAADDARERAEGTAAELREELDDAARRAREELVRRQAEWGALETELRDRLDRSEATRGDVERLTRRAEAAESEIERLTGRAEAAESEIERLTGRAEAAESDIERLRQESAEARLEWDAVESELRERLEREGAERADLEDRLSQAAGATAELRQRLGELRQSRDELEERVARAAKVEAALREQAQELRAAPAELEARLDRATEQLRRLRDTAAAMRSRLDSDLGAAQALDGELAHGLAEVRSVGSSLEERVGGLSAARAGLGDRLTRLAEAWSELEQGLAEAAAEDLEGEGQAGPEVPGLEEAGAPAEVVGEAARVEDGESKEPLASVDLPAAVLEPAAEPASAAVAEGDPGGDRPLEPSAAARLVGAARRAAVRLGLARASAANGNGSAANGNGAAANDNGAAANDNGAAANGNGAAASGNGSGTRGNGSAPGLWPAEPAGEAAAAGVYAEAIDETVRAWVAAWSEQRVEDYLSFYSREFEPAGTETDGDAGAAHRAWLPPLAGMELTLGPISHTELAPGRFAVQFEQRVASDSYARRTGRTLELVREAGAWKIAAESFQEL